jgi:hypothetical protein
VGKERRSYESPREPVKRRDAEKAGTSSAAGSAWDLDRRPRPEGGSTIGG